MSRVIARALRLRRFDVASAIIKRGDRAAVRSDSLAVLAVMSGNVPSLALLLRHGCPASAEAAETAVSMGRLDMLMLLLQHGCALSPDISRRIAEEWPFAIFEHVVTAWEIPISPELTSVAIKKRDVQLLRFAINRGCSVGIGAAVDAAKTGSADLLRELLLIAPRGCIPSPLSADVICAAVLSDSVESVDVALRYGCDLDESVTCIAAYHGRCEILRLLVSAGCPLTPEAVEIARERGHDDAVENLLRDSPTHVL